MASELIGSLRLIQTDGANHRAMKSLPFVGMRFFHPTKKSGMPGGLAHRFLDERGHAMKLGPGRAQFRNETIHIHDLRLVVFDSGA